MAGMRINVLATVLLLSVVGCDPPPPQSQIAVPIQPYQRFVPVAAPQAQMMGVPWTGLFALDTQIGQLCLTTGIYAPEKFGALPTCEVDLKSYPTPGQSSQANGLAK
jgi:hypothetical protein